MTVKELSSSFLRMLRKEVAQSEPEAKKKKKIAVISNELRQEFRASQHFIHKSFSILVTKPETGDRRKTSLQNTNRDHLAISRQCSNDKNWSFPTRGVLKQRSFSICPPTNYNTLLFPVENHYLTMPPSLANTFVDEYNLQNSSAAENVDKEHDEMEMTEQLEENKEAAVIPQSFFKPVLQKTTSSSVSSDENLFADFSVDIQAIQMEFPDGKSHVLEMGWI